MAGNLPLASKDDAPQHGPRPLPLFLEMAREQLQHDPEAMAELLHGLSAFQSAARPAAKSEAFVIGTQGPVTVTRHASADLNRDIDVLIVPSPINAPQILDMVEGRSLIAHLEAQGLGCGLLHWGAITPQRGDETISSFVADYLRPLLQRQKRPVHLVGYCLGGLLALGAACLSEIRSLTLIASPWDFSGYGPDRRSEMMALWARNRAQCKAMRVAPIEMVQQGFWSLDKRRVVEKYRAFGKMDADSPGRAIFVAIEDWANGGEPLPFAFADQLFSEFIEKNASVEGQWKIDGTQISPDAVQAPALELVSASDQITPMATSAGFANRHVYAGGHVGMVVGGSAKQRSWKDISEWLVNN
ncbi:alpha/beta fold hydrolase [Alterisphingorhabdus coralli]|uniref:Alpha/beta fold hydrolase n=1 Tax=Alterisphingorhabdus coralli TaxID=3071408 RepID=A0AA97F4R8_9SPHN|nr:alpha/beta fold hydrolase [Parasphingorhabdus sp. SCSIO 66989]WOE74011.1 alpha/beta fold hydrolase [Parasphingorhabdus sp. SCSIO 66989]